MKQVTLATVEKRIGIPAAKWAGRCYEIASAIVDAELVDGLAVYGHWIGPIARRSIFYPRRHIGFVQHGWIRRPNGTVLDPTRWAFEMVEPYLFHGRLAKCPEYDEGGNQFRKAMTRPVPAFESAGRPIALKLDRESLAHVRFLLGDKDPIDVRRLFWLANLAVDLLHPYAKPIYRAIRKENPEAIPLDNLRMVLGVRE